MFHVNIPVYAFYVKDLGGLACVHSISRFFALLVHNKQLPFLDKVKRLFPLS